MNGYVGFGAAASLSSIQALVSSMQGYWKTYTDSAARAVSGGNCLIVDVAGLAGIQQTLVLAAQVGPLFSSFGGNAASAASQAAKYIYNAQRDKQLDPTGFASPCVDNQFAADVAQAVTYINSAYTSLVQQIQQAQSSTPQSLNLSSGQGGQLTVAVLGWQYSSRPAAAQVQGMFAGTAGLTGSLSVSSVNDTGSNDSLGNPLYVANVIASGSFSGSPASRAGANGTGYNIVLCGSTQWCLGIFGFTPNVVAPPVHTGAPAPTFPTTGPTSPAPIHTGIPAPTFPTAPATTPPGGATPPATTAPGGATTTPPATTVPGATPAPPATSPPVGINLPTSPPAGATAPPAGTSSTGKDVLIGLALTAGLAAIGAGVLWWGYRQHEEDRKKQPARQLAKR